MTPAPLGFDHLLLQLGAMLLAGVACGFVLRRLKMPTVVGEMFAGVLIGVTVLGALAPEVFTWIFQDGQIAPGNRDIIKVGVLFFLYVAGSEIDLSDVRTLGRRSFTIGAIGTILPIALGIGLVYVTPMSMWGESVGIGRLPFAAFIGMNLANSANPVLARILIDLGLMKSRIATVMMTATVVDDLINWTLYAVILGSAAAGAGSGSDRTLAVDLLLVALLFVFVLGFVRWLAPKAVDLARRHLAWPNGYIAVVALAVLGVAALSEWIGVQAFLGAFLVGVAFSGVAAGAGAAGQKAITHVAVGYFAPLFFVSMALTTDFVASFSWTLVVTITVFALASKLVSVLVGVKAAGLPIGREAWAIAWGLNARGATGIILAATGLQSGIINEEVFVALVVMAIVTSLLAGPMMVRSLGPLRGEIDAEQETGEVPHEDTAPAMQVAARMSEPSLTEAERSDAEASPLYRVVVAIDDAATARPLVDVAVDLAASQEPSEVILVAFHQQTAVEGRVHFSVLDEIASDLDSLRGLERIIQSRGLSATSVSQRSADLAADIATQATQLGAHALVVGDRRDDPDWVAIVDGLIADTPVDIYVVVAPLPRDGDVGRTGPPVVELAGGHPGEAAIEAGVRFAVSGPEGLVLVGAADHPRATPPPRPVLDRLRDLGVAVEVVPYGADAPGGVGAASEATFVIRPFSAPEGFEPIERARPDAERFGCPLILVAPAPHDERHTLAALLDHLAALRGSTIEG